MIWGKSWARNTRFEESIMHTPNHSCCAVVGLSFTSGYTTKQNITSQKLEITTVSCLVDSVLHSVNDAVINWVLGLIDLQDKIEEVTCFKFSIPDIISFQKELWKPLLLILGTNCQLVYLPRYSSCFQYFQSKSNSRCWFWEF